jgi:hypothetical protein
MPGQLHLAGCTAHGLADTSRRPAHARQPCDLAIGQDMSARNALHHLPYRFNPLIEVGSGYGRAVAVLLVHVGSISVHTGGPEF